MGELRVVLSVAALLALFILSPEPLQVKAFAAYFQLGIIISLSAIVWIFAVVLKHRGYGKLIRSAIWYIVADPPSVFVGLMLAIYLVAFGLNFIIFWLLLLVAGLLKAIGGRGRKKGQASYQTLSRADRKPGVFSEQFLFPMATISSCAAIFILALADADIDYRSVFWILLAATTARLVGYSASDMSPATEGLTTNLRRRYCRPRLMYLLLLLLEGGNLLLLLTALRSSEIPPLPPLYEYKETLFAIYQPDSWYRLFASSLGFEEYLAAFSAIMFNISLLSYIVQFMGIAALVGKGDPFAISDSDFIALAEDAIHSEDYGEAEKYLDAVQIRTHVSQKTEMRLRLAKGDVECAARAAQKCRELSNQKTDSSSLFRLMLSEVRKERTLRHAENQVLAWATANGVTDEELAHALVGFTPGSSGLHFVKDALVALGFFDENTMAKNSAELERQLCAALDQRCRDFPLSVFVILKLGLPEFVNSELHSKVLRIIRQRSYGILGDAIMAVFAYNEDSLRSLEALSVRYRNYMNDADVNEDELLGPLHYIPVLTDRIGRMIKNQEMRHAFSEISEVLAIWNSIEASARNDRELDLIIRHIRARLRRARRTLR